MVDIGPSPNEPSGEYITILVAWKGGDRLIMLSPDGARGGRIWAEMQKCRTVNSCLNDKELAALISSKKADGVRDVTFNRSTRTQTPNGPALAMRPWRERIERRHPPPPPPSPHFGFCVEGPAIPRLWPRGRAAARARQRQKNSRGTTCAAMCGSATALAAATEPSQRAAWLFVGSLLARCRRKDERSAECRVVLGSFVDDCWARCSGPTGSPWRSCCTRSRRRC